MREMKDSGIEWIGEIPKEWKKAKIKYFVKVNSGEIISKEEYVDNGAFPIIGSNGEIGRTNKHNNEEKVITTGRVGTIGTIHIVGESWITDNVLIIKSNNINQKYLSYIMVNFDFKHMISGTAQPLITATNLKNQYITFPSLIEQQKIAYFLDEKCTNIDYLISELKKQTETLEEYKRSVITETVTKGLNPDAKMKDSGVQWIGNMPEHWKLIKGKYILKYISKPIRQTDGIITCFRDGEVTLRSNRREEGFTMADKEIGYQGIDIGDLVVHGMDGFAGAIGISDSRGKASPVLNVLDTMQNKRYIMYYLRSMAYNDVFLALATGIRVRSCDLRWNKLAELLYPIPPAEEQKQIVEYVDHIINCTDDIISEKKQQIKIIKEYKKSLIYEVVTGKNFDF